MQNPTSFTKTAISYSSGGDTALSKRPVENVNPNPVLRTYDESIIVPLRDWLVLETSCLNLGVLVACSVTPLAPSLSILCVLSGCCACLILFVFIMVDGDKPPKNKGKSFGSEEHKIDQYHLLFLHINDTSRVPLINFKLEGLWKKVLCKNNGIYSGSSLSQYYHKFNALWRQYDSLVNLPDCVFGYPPNIQKNNNNGFNKGSSSSNVVSGNKDQSTSNSFTDDQFKKLMALISDKLGSSSMLANIAVSKLNMTVGHPNGTKIVVTHMGSLRLTDQIVIQDVLVVPGDVKFYETMFPFKNNTECKEYEMVFGDKNSHNFFNYDEKEFRRDEGEHPDDSEPAQAVSDIEENATLVENDKESKGDDSFYQEFNKMFEIPNMVPDNQSEINLRRSSRKTSMPKKFSDFKVKYNIDKHVNYSYLSLENFNFSTSLNKFVEPKTFNEASKDIRWVEARNLEMEALNRNGTWVITELPVGRKPIGSKWVFKVKYKSTREAERFKARVVAKGFNQKEGIDYKETFSLVVKIVLLDVFCLLLFTIVGLYIS
ncbi:ribonuclease H-like domain-containing protein [Tanacetum coccineum]